MDEAPGYVQQGRLLTLRTPLGEDVLLPIRFEGREAVGEPFLFEVTARAKRSDIKARELVGQQQRGQREQLRLLGLAAADAVDDLGIELPRGRRRAQEPRARRVRAHVVAAVVALGRAHELRRRRAPWRPRFARRARPRAWRQWRCR